MQQDKQQMFQNRLAKVYRHLSKIARKKEISCYRLYDHDLPEFPLCIELYGDKIHISEYKRRHHLTDEMHEYWLQDTLQSIMQVLPVERNDIFIKLRQRKEGRAGQYIKNDDSQKEYIVQENRLQFIVNLSDYLDTGLFLDHRITRQMVMEQSRGKKVLNLFAYTGSFSVYAAAGDADKVCTIDLSNTYIQWAKNNMQLNGFTDTKKYEYIVGDAVAYLKQLAAGSFDIIILDPPTFSNSKKTPTVLDIQRDHVTLINDCLRVLANGGILYFSTNLKNFSLYKDAIGSTNIENITKATTPFDFEGRLFRYCYRITKS